MIKTKIYENGLKLVVDEMKNFNSVSFNLFVKTGSVNEKDGNYGISHFIEHMLFKGTKRRSSLEISKTLDNIGANVNAFTDKEETCYYTKSTAENIEICVDVLSDMLFNSEFDNKEMTREKKVVIEEISMYEDDASSKCEMLANQAFYAGTNFESDVAGSKQSVRRLNKEKIDEYMREYYVPKNITLSFAGKISFEKAEKLVQKYFVPYFSRAGKSANATYKNPKKINILKSFKDNEQSHVCISFPAEDRDGNFFAGKIFDVVFGIGMSSILFQRIREQLGLVYSINSSAYNNCAGGDITIHFATNTKNVKLALTAIAEEIKLILANGITNEQFENAKNNLVSRVKMAFEETSFVSLFNARKMAYQSEILTQEDYIKGLKNCTIEDLNAYIKKCFKPDFYSISYVGNNTRLKLEDYFKI